MHIKQITISNFRSFRQQPEITPFSPGTNAVVGRNGSGKSNLFDAVQFVLLSPKFYTLRTEERQSLLHEGSGSAAVSAFVEIVFDNSDGRFNTESASDEVVLRRTVGHKKDEFFLQRKRTQKTEIMSLLEGAGFSKSNPYFIVQQGKVNALCTMGDGERLALLKEVAGTTVYDEKKQESLKKMAANQQDIAKIEEILGYINDKLDDLQGEKEELSQYQTLDRDRRAVEYTLYDKELRKARETLDDLEHRRAESTNEWSVLHEEARTTHDDICQAELTLKTNANNLRRNKMQLSSLDETKTNKMTIRTKLELECRELEEGINQSRELVRSNAKELSSVDKKIETTKMALSTVAIPAYELLKTSFTQISDQKKLMNQKLEALYAKQSRNKHYATQAERDIYLQRQIRDLESQLKTKAKLLKENQHRLKQSESKLNKNSNSIQIKEKEESEMRTVQNTFATSIEELKRDRDSLANKRRDVWRDLDQLHDTVAEARDDYRRLRSLNSKSIPRATRIGLEALPRILDELKISDDQYFGRVIDNFTLQSDEYRIGVEIAAQNALHHVIVDTDQTAAKLMERLERGKLGRVTFLPLNRLHVENIQYPEANDVTSLLSTCLDYHPSVAKAMKHVFGGKLLCRNVEAASHWSVRTKMDAITLAGDLCSRKGSLTGGFVDLSKSTIGTNEDMKAAKKLLDKLQAQEEEMESNNQKVDKQLSKQMGDLQHLEAKRANILHALQKIKDDVENLKVGLIEHEKDIEVSKEDNVNLDGEYQHLNRQVKALRDEMGTVLTDELSSEERKMLTKIKKSMKNVEKELEEKRMELEEKSVERERLKSLLDDNLLKKKKELEVIANDGNGEGGFTDTSVSNMKRESECRKQELVAVEKDVQDILNKLRECKKVDKECKSASNSSQNELEKLRSQDAANKRKIEEATEGTDRLLNKRAMCVSKRELYTRKIQELGSLPTTSAIAAYKNLSISGLMQKLEKLNKSLKKYSHVNKKAFDQYVNFSEQRETLISRKQELDQGAEKVKELVEELDRRKDEAIHRTFKGVSGHFVDVFKDLVPNGGGELIMKTALPNSNDDSDLSDEEDESTSKISKKQSVHTSVSLYRGVGIKVRFSPVGENYLMSQLSGGQKALVALALIFAIQRCDPAPFYLFDELDQALDSTYRAAVANVIKKQANCDALGEEGTQFICSTFRPELVSAANQCYGISHQNKVSNIHSLGKKDALEFIANLMNAEETLGVVASSRKRKKKKGIADGGQLEQ